MVGLNNATRLWATPTSQNAKHGVATPWELEHRPKHLHVMAAWATPRSRDHKGVDNTRAIRGAHGGDDLPTQTAQWSTPNARDDKGQPGRPSSADGSRQMSPPRDVGASGTVGSLDPAWVSCLCGLPPTYLNLTDSLEDVTAWVRDPQWPARPGFAQHEFEGPRLGTAIPQRIKKLRALGNIVIPPQALPLLNAIVASEKKRKDVTK